MNKFSNIFGQILQIFTKTEFQNAVIETKAEKKAKEFTCLRTICRHAVLSYGTGPFLKRDMREIINLSRKGKTPGDKGCSLTFYPVRYPQYIKTAGRSRYSLNHSNRISR